jgi:hypothetical protein
MIYPVALLSTILITGTGFTLPAYAAGQKSWVFKGTCSKGNIAESDGVQTGAASGMMGTKDYFALMQRAKAAHLTVGSDGFLWSTEPLHCDSVAIVQMDDYKGHRMVTFSNGDPDNPILGFAGGLVDGDGTILLADTVYLTDGKAMPLNPGPNAPRCQFYYTNNGYKAERLPPGLDPITHAQLAAKAEAEAYKSWETRVNTIECDLRVKGADGHLVNGNVTFDVSQPPPVPEPSRDPATDKPQNLP